NASTSALLTQTVNKRTSATTATCSPATRPANSPTTCTATVTDTGAVNSGAAIPAGTVTFTSSGTGTFSPPAGTCTLNPSGMCSVTYTPNLVGTGTHTITAAFGGDTTHKTSSGTFALGAGARSTTTDINCSPNPLAVHTPTTCTATVADNESSGTKTAPL